MAGSYFELLTEQQGLPVKPFDPLEELRRLRRSLAARMHHTEFSSKTDLLSHQNPRRTKDLSPSEPVLLEAVVRHVDTMKKTLAVWKHARFQAKLPCDTIFRSKRMSKRKRDVTTVIAQYKEGTQEGVLETLNAGLSVLGLVGIVVGIMNFYRFWESDVTLGSLVCTSGVAIVVIGIGGRCLASRSDA